MAVIILNVSRDHGVEYGHGLQHYELKINKRILCEVTHVYEDGVVSLLRKAADIFEQEEEA